jgi:uncharacterized membrane protein HdeD (DUF308 family)
MDGTRREAPDARAALMWWLLLLRAGIALLLGLVVLTSGASRASLGNFIGIYWLLGSVLTLRWMLANRRQGRNGLVLVAALVGMVAGVIVLLRFLLEDVISTDRAMAILGVSAILTGLLRLFGGFRDDRMVNGRPRRSHRAAQGVLELMLGAVLIIAYQWTRPVAIVVGLWALVGGTVLLGDALALRRMHRGSDQSRRDTASGTRG